MKIHEYQAKELFKTYGILTPSGIVVKNPKEAVEAARTIGPGPWVLKAQIHAGGRGKGGGIRTAVTLEEVETTALHMLGKRLVTAQTGPEGSPVGSLLVEEVLDIGKEVYLGIAVDRQRERLVLLASAEGGMDIERVARDAPERLITERIDPAVGLRPFQAARTFWALGLDGSFSRPTMAIIASLYRLFVEKGCSLAEINPLVVTKGGALVALDAKMNIDDNGLYRHPDIREMRDIAQENALEVEASKYNLNYIKLKGTVGCMVNGAGLAMATMDLIKIAGAEPANFLDVGGGATSEMISQGLKILLYDEDVRVIFVNIFGGILRCDTLAKGVVEAAKELAITLPMVIRLEGTNVEEGRRILGDSGLAFTVATGMADAAAKVVQALEGR